MKIKELPMDQKTTITLLLTSIEEKETRNSSPYCTLTLTDGIDTIIAQLWNTKKENVKVQEKTLISAEIYKKMYNESVSYEVYLIAIGSFCLCIIAIIPFIVSGLTGLSRLSFFGTSIIITVSVILETKKLILSKTQENYYMNRVKKGGLFRG